MLVNIINKLVYSCCFLIAINIFVQKYFRYVSSYVNYDIHHLLLVVDPECLKVQVINIIYIIMCGAILQKLIINDLLIEILDLNQL